MTSDFKTIRKLYKGKRIHLKDLYQVSTNKPKKLSGYFLSQRHFTNLN